MTAQRNLLAVAVKMPGLVSPTRAREPVCMQRECVCLSVYLCGGDAQEHSRARHARAHKNTQTHDKTDLNTTACKTTKNFTDVCTKGPCVYRRLCACHTRERVHERERERVRVRDIP